MFSLGQIVDHSCKEPDSFLYQSLHQVVLTLLELTTKVLFLSLSSPPHTHTHTYTYTQTHMVDVSEQYRREDLNRPRRRQLTARRHNTAHLVSYDQKYPYTIYLKFLLLNNCKLL